MAEQQPLPGTGSEIPPVFNQVFQEKFRTAMLDMLHILDYSHALACFYKAYEYRKGFPWLVESGKSPDKMYRNGLAYALRAALSTYIVPSSDLLESMKRPSADQQEEVGDQEYLDVQRIQRLAIAIDATVQEGYSLMHFEQRLASTHIDVASVPLDLLQQHIAAALLRYYDRRLVGVPPEPI